MIGETLQPLASIRPPPTGVMWISIDPDTFEPVTIDSAGTIRRFRGNDGRATLNGTSDPGPGVGANGDFYINTASWYIFGPKAAGTWPAGVSLTSGGGATYVHTQASASSTWTINHNLGFKPSIELIDAGGSEFSADIVHSTVNTAIVSLTASISGIARCN